VALHIILIPGSVASKSTLRQVVRVIGGGVSFELNIRVENFANCLLDGLRSSKGREVEETEDGDGEDGGELHFDGSGTVS
jgi:hypothetical protein